MDRHVPPDLSPSPVPRKMQRLDSIAQHVIASPAIEVEISSLPDGPLVAIIQHLPWRDRVRVERVSRRWRHLALADSWAGVKSFDALKYNLRSEAHMLETYNIVRLLERCGRYLDSVTLWGFDKQLENMRTPAIKLLNMCPRLSRISFNDLKVGSATINYLLSRFEHGGLRSSECANER